ncbi:MAG: sugar transferase [Mariprofundaceae bacterium]|nr:sugar transferase [Mariprofundaceae bacterium]
MKHEAKIALNSTLENTGTLGSNPKTFKIFKRSIDVILGTFFLVLSLPVILLAALFIRIESKGNPFFLQERVGKNGQMFRIVKLRGMYVDARKRFPELYDYNELFNGNNLDKTFHHQEDPRLTRVGRFTRKTSIDELPNFINVLTGSMSIVGIRPEIPELFEKYGTYKNTYISMRPGITSLSKCSGRDNLTLQESLQMDVAYLHHQTALGDLKIIFKTISAVLLRKDVY